MSISFAMLLSLLLLLSSNCSGIRDREDQKATQDTRIMGCPSNALDIDLNFIHSHGQVTLIDLDAYYQKYAATRHLTSQKLSVLCAITNYETEFSGEIKVTVHCTLSAKAIATMQNESSTSYRSCLIYKITRQIASIIRDYLWLEPETTVLYRGGIVTFNLDRSHPTQNVGGIVQMASNLSFSTSRPVRYLFGELGLRIAVPVRSVPGQFVNTSYDENHKETQIAGFWIDVFKAATEMMPININYKLIPFYDSDDQLLKEVGRKTFDAAVGLTVITEEGLKLLEFSRPYFEVGPTLVTKKNPELNQVFSFLSPFTNEMWLTMASMTFFNAFVIWLIERRTTGNESDGSPSRQVGAVFWFPFATLFYGVHRESPRNSLTYFVLGPWLLLILIVTSTYTASFTSMITSSDTESPCLDIENLKTTNAIIGCDEDFIIFKYLVEVIGFQRKNIRHISLSSIDDYAKALSSESIKAAFFPLPYAEVFLAKYCKYFSASYQIHGLAGSLIVFPRGSPFVSAMSEAMLRLTESGELVRMKQNMLSFSDGSRSTIDRTMKRGIGPGPFSGLFILSGGASAIALTITVVRMMKRRWESLFRGCRWVEDSGCG